MPAIKALSNAFAAGPGGSGKVGPVFSENVTVIVDETNRDAPRQAALDFFNSRVNQYRPLLDVRMPPLCPETFDADGPHPTF